MSEPLQVPLHYIFSDFESAEICAAAMTRLGSPARLFPNQITARYSLPISLNDGRAALPLNLADEIVIHKAAIPDDPAANPYEQGAVAVLIRNLAGPPNEADIAGWNQVVAALRALPERGDPSLNGLEPVLRVPLGGLMPSGALEDLMTMDELVAAGLVAGDAEVIE